MNPHRESDEIVLSSQQVARWLLLPCAFVLGHWGLLLEQSLFLSALPALWTTGGKGVAEVLPPHPKTKSQAFELGWLAAEFEAGGCGRHDGSAKCAGILQRAAEVVEKAEPLTAAQLQGARAFLVELDNQRSIVDRVLGFFSFVNVIWLVSIVGIVCTVGPCVAYLVGPMLLTLAERLFRNVIQPVVQTLHRYGAFEAVAYLLAFAFSAQGCRYPPGQEDAAIMVALTGALAFGPCWAYSTSLHVGEGGGDESKFLTVTYGLTFMALAPLAVVHDSRLIGFFAVVALYGALGFVFFAFGFGFAIGFNDKDSTKRCLAASVFLVAGFAMLRLCGADPALLRPFGTGAMVMGNVAYFLALLILASRWRSDDMSYVARQGAMIASLLVALFVGFSFSMPSMSNTASTFLVLYLMEKELEVRWNSAGVVVMFANFVLLYYLAHYLHTHPEHVMSMFDPSGLFA